MKKVTAQKEIRDGIGEALLQLGETNPDIVCLSADLTESTRLLLFKQKYPTRFIQTGVCEQNMAGIAAGLALAGKVPFMSSFAVFSPGRNWDQIRVSICYSQANVKLIGSHAGFSNGPDGATHEGLEDIALVRVLPNMVVLCPADFHQAKALVALAAKHKGPVYIRSFKGNSQTIYTEQDEFEIGNSHILREGKDLTIVSAGPILSEVLKAADNLATKYKIDVEVLNMYSIKPLDTHTLLNSGRKTRKMLVVEEHQQIGGLGSAVAEYLSQELPIPIQILGVRDTFGESGSRDALLEKYELCATHIEMNAKNLYHR
jgi:transketolase